MYKRWKKLQLINDGKEIGRFGEGRIVDETNGIGLDFVEKTEGRFWSTTPDMGAVL